MRQIVLSAIALLVASVIAGKMMEQRTSMPLTPAALVTAPQSGPTSNPGSVVIEPGPGGHFQVQARVDGRRVDFMVDTGASFIALRESEADRLGYHVTARDYTLRMGTANGETRAAPIEISMLEVEGITVHNVKAVVHPDRALGVNLLGMTFLSRVRWTHDRGRLVLEQ
jgi:aspartyl protease family protein